MQTSYCIFVRAYVGWLESSGSFPFRSFPKLSDYPEKTSRRKHDVKCPMLTNNCRSIHTSDVDIPVNIDESVGEGSVAHGLEAQAQRRIFELTSLSTSFSLRCHMVQILNEQSTSLY
jgi:hypothetical protein